MLVKLDIYFFIDNFSNPRNKSKREYSKGEFFYLRFVEFFTNMSQCGRQSSSLQKRQQKSN